jgi:predicted enzyme related to lactoylglutathione lyase
MPRPVHFDFSAQDPERAARFYGDVFGWRIQKWGGPQDYWLIETGAGTPGIDGGMSKRPEGDDHGHVVVTIDVADVDAAMERVSQAGGTVTSPKMAIPGVGWLVYFLDPEGNVFGMMQSDASAT